MNLEEFIASLIVGAARYTFVSGCADGVVIHIAKRRAFHYPEAYDAFCEMEHASRKQWNWNN